MKNAKLTSFDINKTIRKTWTMSPVTRVKASKKIYSRKNYKISSELS